MSLSLLAGRTVVSSVACTTDQGGQKRWLVPGRKRLTRVLISWAGAWVLGSKLQIHLNLKKEILSATV